ncbi:uncharacterized protein UV8b_06264 [Ustilaginoidea virens]|uniref:Uncharacterized protein n=1 Tax=Ustilaginoidea virens TaxID=1159556 RepID=A0A8E5MIX4_USTVR|nr:uncharacterized protein UV8b_06264 [Ustilaginoidea virens]QUC22023.1 hypothetical protein UV8b_06264 [Ustilaginoidea virens]
MAAAALAASAAATVETIAVQRVTVDVDAPYAAVVERFRRLVPPVRLAELAGTTSAEGVAQVVGATGTATGFVLFAEFNHGRWMGHFARGLGATDVGGTDDGHGGGGGGGGDDGGGGGENGGGGDDGRAGGDSDAGGGSAAAAAAAAPAPRAAHRFVFGNPLVAWDMVRQDIEAVLHVPLDCAFVEKPDGSARMILLLRDGLVAGHAAMAANQSMHSAAQQIDDKVYRLIERLAQS